MDFTRVQRGAAAVEWVGVVVMVTLLMAGLISWSVTTFSPPERPPDPIAVVAEPLAGAVGPLAGLGEGAAPWLTRPMSRGGGAGRRFLGWLGRTSVAAAALGRDMATSFGGGFAGAARDRWRAFLDNPLGGLINLPDASGVTSAGLLRRYAVSLVKDPGALWAYFGRMRTMSPRQIAVELSRQAGEFTADASIEVVELFVKRLLLRAITRRGRGAPPAARVP